MEVARDSLRCRRVGGRVRGIHWRRDLGVPGAEVVNVLNVERAAGCRDELKDLLDQWKIHGTFDIEVAENGGYRFGPEAELAQANFFATGLSKAKALEDTAHGRRCAVDCHPVGFNPHRDFTAQPGMRAKFRTWGLFVEACGLVWGGRFGGFGSDGDMAHAEIPHWRTLFQFPSGELVVQGAT